MNSFVIKSGGVGWGVNTGHGHPTAQTASRFIVGRGEAAVAWFSGKRLPLLRRCRLLFFSLLFAFINANILQQESVSTKDGGGGSGGRRWEGEKPEWRYSKEARAVSVHLQLLPCSSR